MTIHVVSSETGTPLEHINVGIYVGLDGVYKSVTDHDGEAHFRDVKPGHYEYYVDGNKRSGRLEGRKTVYI